MDMYEKLMEVLGDEALAKELEGMSEADAKKILEEKGIDLASLDNVLEDAPEAELTPEQMDEVSGGAKVYCRFCGTTFKSSITYWLHIQWNAACQSQVRSNKIIQGIK